MKNHTTHKCLHNNPGGNMFQHISSYVYSFLVLKLFFKIKMVCLKQELTVYYVTPFDFFSSLQSKLGLALTPLRHLPLQNQAIPICHMGKPTSELRDPSTHPAH
jgi:hypothetical protein